MNSPAERTNVLRRRRRAGIRLFFVVVVCVIVADVLPPSVYPIQAPKRWLRTGLTYAGLWQGQWAMFSPNPSINNTWLSAEYVNDSGELVTWNSPYWASVGTWEKFYRFRYLNFYSRLQLNHNAVAAGDFAQFLRRSGAGQESAETAGDYEADPSGTLPKGEVRLFVSGLRLVIPEDGSLPPRDEALWVSFSEVLGERTPP